MFYLRTTDQHSYKIRCFFFIICVIQHQLYYLLFEQSGGSRPSKAYIVRSPKNSKAYICSPEDSKANVRCSSRRPLFVVLHYLTSFILTQFIFTRIKEVPPSLFTQLKYMQHLDISNNLIGKENISYLSIQLEFYTTFQDPSILLLYSSS